MGDVFSIDFNVNDLEEKNSKELFFARKKGVSWQKFGFCYTTEGDFMHKPDILMVKISFCVRT